MSKRAGDFVTLKNLIDEVGSDVVRFMMVYRTNDSELDFDFDLVKSQSKDNPVYYVQYAYARISSMLRKVKKIQALKIEDLDELDNEIEINIIKKIS
ncbi:MAG: DALR anticodon-binding domain-containing protein, partial [Candidatus Fonsibacter sp.]